MNNMIDDHASFRDVKPTPNILFGGLLLFFWLEYTRPGSYFSVIELAHINTIIPVIVFMATYLSHSGRANSEIFKALNTKWFIFFIILFPVQILTADVKIYVFVKFTSVVGYLLIYFVIVKQVTNIQRLKKIFSTLIIMHLLLIILNPKILIEPEKDIMFRG